MPVKRAVGPARWMRSFPYKGTTVLVVRDGNAWELSYCGQTVKAGSPIEAFESLTGAIDMPVLLAVLAHDRSKQAPSPATTR